jgi:hypothetical protein
MTEHTIDPAIVEAVHAVANRFGAAGLEDLITEAQRELGEARAALEQLAEETP